MSTAQTQFELRFTSLTGAGSSYRFPCDHTGCVDMNLLSERDCLDYLFARGSVGYALTSPAVFAIAM